MFLRRFLIIFFIFSVFIFQSTWAQEKEQSKITHSLGAYKYETNSSLVNKIIPDVSIIGSFAAAYFNDDPAGDTGHDPARTGFTLQEIELALQSIVDPYLRADIFLSFNENGVELEEGYGTTLSFPKGLQLRAGKIKLPFGRHNEKHLETWYFADSPLMNKYVFGPESLSELGVELSYIFPTLFFLQLQGSFTNGDNEESFNGGRKQDFLYQTRASMSVDLNPELTLLWGGSAAWGYNDTGAGNTTTVYGGDLFLKWKPKAYRSLVWQTEYIYRQLETPTSFDADGGLYSLIDYQFLKRWHGGLRFDWVGIPDEALGKEWRISPALTFNPTEFSRVRLQYNYDHPNGAHAIHAVMGQFEFSMGPHGTHPF